MRYHIVRTTDTIDRIANIYNMTIQEIKNRAKKDIKTIQYGMINILK